MKTLPIPALLLTALKPRTVPKRWQVSQALGSEIITNGGLSLWTGNVPTGMFVANDNGTTAILRQSNPDGSAGTGAAKLHNDTSAVFLILQSNADFVTGLFYQIAYEMTANTAGRADVLWGTGTNNPACLARSTVGQARSVSLASGDRVRWQMGAAVPREFVLDNLSGKLVTHFPVRTMLSANMRVSAFFTVPASPIAGDNLLLPLRISSLATGDLLYAELQYTTAGTWGVTLYTVAGFVRTATVATASGIGTCNGLRVNANGSSLTLETTADGGGSWTQRGSTATSALYSSAKLATVVATDVFTLGALTYEAAA